VCLPSFERCRLQKRWTSEIKLDATTKEVWDKVVKPKYKEAKYLGFVGDADGDDYGWDPERDAASSSKVLDWYYKSVASHKHGAVYVMGPGRHIGGLAG
jgi:hypothetical protein